MCLGGPLLGVGLSHDRGGSIAVRSGVGGEAGITTSASLISPCFVLRINPTREFILIRGDRIVAV